MLLGAAEAMWSRHGTDVTADGRALQIRELSTRSVRDRLSAEEYAEAFAEGNRLTADQGMDLLLELRT
jgi:hypothetical protein